MASAAGLSTAEMLVGTKGNLQVPWSNILDLPTIPGQDQSHPARRTGMMNSPHSCGDVMQGSGPPHAKLALGICGQHEAQHAIPRITPHLLWLKDSFAARGRQPDAPSLLQL